MLFLCPNCDRPIEVEDELAGHELECPGCGVVNVVPASQPAGPRRACPSCGAPLSPGTPVCASCGQDPRTVREGLDGDREHGAHVDAGLALWLRAAIVGLVAAPCVVLVAVLGARSQRWVAPIFVYVTLVAGTFPRIAIVRRSDGRPLIRKTDFAALIPYDRTEYDPREYEALVASYQRTFNPGAAGCGLVLLLAIGFVIPGVAWWLYASQKGTHRLELKARGSENLVTLYAGTAGGTVRAVVNMIQSAHYLPCQ